MNIAVYAPKVFDGSRSTLENFIGETLFELTRRQPEHKFFIISHEKISEKIRFNSNTELIDFRKPSKNLLLKKLWQTATLPSILKKTKADILFTIDNAFSSKIAVRQCVMITGSQKIKMSFIKVGGVLITISEKAKMQIAKKENIAPENISVIYPFANEKYESVDDERNESIKNKYSDNKEYFLYSGVFAKQEDFIHLLRSFSHFKKRQQSSFKLLIITNKNFEKELAGYKYRNDINLIESENEDELVMITASAYAVVLPFNLNEDVITALNSMAAGVPVITTKGSIISEFAGDAVLYAENEIKDIAEKMMLLYKDEPHRSKQIEKGKMIANTFTKEKAAGLMWQSIMKAL